MIRLLASLLVMVAVLTQGELASAESHPAINFDADNLSTGFIPDGKDADGNYNSFYWQPLWTHGWSFGLSEPSLLTHLAMYDYRSDGLQNDFRVGIWGISDPDFFIEGTVAGGEEAPLVGSWRLVDIEDVLLQPGIYAIGARLQSEQNEEAYLLHDFCSEHGFGCDTIPDTPPEGIEDQFFWNFGSVEDGYDHQFIANDPRVDAKGSSPGFNGDLFNADVYADFSPPTSSYAVNGAFVGPNFFLAPVPEPTTGVLAAIALLCMSRRSRQ